MSTKPLPAKATPAAVQATGKTSATTRSLKAGSAKPVVKPATTMAKPATAKKPVSKVVSPAKSKPVPKAKVKKPKLVRDSFTIPKPEYLVLDVLKARANQLASPAKKGELLRAGIKALAAMSNVEFLVALKAVPAIKTGRPSTA